MIRALLRQAHPSAAQDLSMLSTLPAALLRSHTFVSIDVSRLVHMDSFSHMLASMCNKAVNRCIVCFVHMASYAGA